MFSIVNFSLMLCWFFEMFICLNLILKAIFRVNCYFNGSCYKIPWPANQWIKLHIIFCYWYTQTDLTGTLYKSLTKVDNSYWVIIFIAVDILGRSEWRQIDSVDSQINSRINVQNITNFEGRSVAPQRDMGFFCLQHQLCFL